MSVKSVMTALADQVRRLSGKTGTMSIETMTSELANVTKGIDTSDANAAAKDIANGKTAYVNGAKVTGSMPDNGTVSKTLDTSTTSYTIPAGKHSGSGKVSITTQEKSVTPGTSAQTVTPDSGKVLSKVSVGAVASATQATPSISVSSGGLITASVTQTEGYVAAGTTSATKQLTTKGATTITPTSSVQTAVSAGTYVTGDIKVAAASGGGKTGYFVGAETQTRTIDVGVTLSNSDKFFLYCSASATSYAYAVIDVWCMGSSDTNLRYTNSAGELKNPEYDGVTYSGSKVTITSKMGYFKSGFVYNWMLLQG